KYQYKGGMLNGGFGYFLNSENNKRLRFEVFGDFSFGTYNNQIMHYEQYHGSNGPVTGNFSNGNFQRTGILMNIGYLNKREFLTLGYTARLSNIIFSNATFGNPAPGLKEQQILNSKPNYQML